jgi:hypothetical protein
MGRLHAVAHLGRLLHDTSVEDGRRAADAWVADTQRAVLAAEGITPEQVTVTLAALEDTFPPGPAINGVREMLKAMNDADVAPTVPSTTQLGDRLVHSSGGLPAGLGRWVKAAAGRRNPVPDSEAPDPGTVDEFVRWFAEPTRRTLWSRLTAQRAELERNTGWLVVVLSPALWLAIAVIGAAAVVGAAVVATGWAWAVAAAGGILLTLGVATTLFTRRLHQGRQDLADWVAAKLQP